MAHLVSKQNKATHRIPQTLKEAFELMKKRIEYLAFQLSEKYPAIKEDLILAGLIAVDKALRRYKPNGAASFRTFADKVVTNAMIDHQRKEMKDRLTQEEMGQIARALDARDQENRERTTKIREITEEGKHLPQSQQDVIATGLHGESTNEIAKALGLSERHTKRFQKAGIAELQERLIPPSVLARMRK